MLTFQTPARAETEIKRSISLDSGYIPSIGSVRSFWNFGHELEDFGGLLFDAVSEETFFGHNPLTRLLWATGMVFGWSYQQSAFFLANHEYGHGARTTAAGGTASYGFSNGTGTHDFIFLYYLAALPKTGGGYAVGSGTDLSKTPPQWGLATSAGGVNNSMNLAEYFEHQIHNQRGHLLSFNLYYLSKLDSAFYATSTLAGQTFNGGSGDIANVVNSYALQGHSISVGDIQVGGFAAFLASATTYSYAYSFFKYLFTGDPSVESPHLGDFQVPNVSHFLNMEGISFRFNSGIRGGEGRWPFSLEVQYKGKFAVEVGVGHEIEPGFSWMLYANSFPALGGRANYSVNFGKSSKFNLTLAAYQLNLFEGQRVSQNHLSSAIGLEGSVRYSVLY